MSDLTAAVEAGARAVAALAGDNWDRLDVQWNGEKAELIRNAYRRRARKVLEAAAPIIEAAARADERTKTAEEVAVALEALRDVPDAPQWESTPVIEETLTQAAAIARQHTQETP